MKIYVRLEKSIVKVTIKIELISFLVKLIETKAEKLSFEQGIKINGENKIVTAFANLAHRKILRLFRYALNF